MTFRTPIKVCFSDVDHAGIVYYPRFMHYFHLAMEGFFNSVLGVDYSIVMHEHKFSLPTVHLESDFRQRVKYGDHIDMEVSILRIGRSSITWAYKGYRVGGDATAVVEGHNVTVCANIDTFEKIDIPDWLRQGLIEYKAEAEEK